MTTHLLETLLAVTCFVWLVCYPLALAIVAGLTRKGVVK